MLHEHERKVAALAEQVKGFYERNESFRVYHGNTNSTRVVEFDAQRMVDTSGFDKVLEVNEERKVAIVEANVPMDTLVRATLPHGLVSPVVMEFPGITVAGGLQGGAGESSSFKWGEFNSTINWFEMVLANGEVVRASPEEHADLFYGAAGAYGSLGVMTRAEVELIQACRFVRLEYVPVGSFGEAAEVIREKTKTDADFVDGVMFGPERGVVMVGRMTDEAAGELVRFSRPWDDWFFLRVEKLLKSASEDPDYVPLYDYFFRYDRGAFWMGKYAFERFGKPFNRVTRFLLDRLMHTRTMYEALQASGVGQEFIIQDLAMPPEKVVGFMEWLDGEFAIYPMWLCPLRVGDAGDRSQLMNRPLKGDYALNVGVWGFVSQDLDKVVAADRRLEKKVGELGGRKWLYAYSYYSEEEFWKIFDKKWYNDLRKKYHAETLKNVYERVCLSRRYAVRANFGVAVALLGRRGIRISKR